MEQEYSFANGEGYSIASMGEGRFCIKDEREENIRIFGVRDNCIFFVDIPDTFRAQTAGFKKITEIIMDFMQVKGILPEIDLNKLTPMELCDNLNNLGLVISKDGLVCSLYHLPDGFETIKGVPYLGDLAIPKGAKIPDNLTVNGDLILSRSISSLTPKNLKVEGKIFAPSLEKVALDVPDEVLLITKEDVNDFVCKPQSVKSIYTDGFCVDIVPKTRSEKQVQNLKILYAIPHNLTLQKIR